ncbi:MAG: hypothetical protein DI629_07060 [Mesorhizobium amorphae]|nr:MAG: hypothetical protein DI629_07060 [Mesorhizobium amorphae]
MHFAVKDDHKRKRLTDRREIARALEIFREHGCDENELLEEMLALFYVDLDEYQAALNQAA